MAAAWSVNGKGGFCLTTNFSAVEQWRDNDLLIFMFFVLQKLAFVPFYCFFFF